MKQTICLLLCTMLLLLAASCGKKEAGPADTTLPQGNTGETTTENLYDENGYWKDDLPDDLNFQFEEVNVLAWETGKDDFDTDDINTANIIQTAVYQRNAAVERRLNISFDFQYASHNTTGDYVSRVTNNHFSGLKEFDLLGGYTRDIASCVMKGYTQDLGALTYVNLEQPWWPASLREKSMLNGKLYFASGDIAHSNITSIGVVFFNKQIIENQGMEDPYALVESGAWTLDKMFEMAKQVYIDNGETSGEKDDTDTYGYVTNSLQSQQLYWGCGMSWVEVNDQGQYQLSEDFIGAKMEAYLAKLTNLLFTENAGYLSDVGVKQFDAGRVLFITNALSYSQSRFSTNRELKYGIVPSPKWDAAQTQYYGSIGNATTLYAIPQETPNPALSDAALEAMASESYRSVSPIVCERAFGTRYAPDDTFGKIFDIIRQGIVYEPGRIFNNVLDEDGISLANSYNVCVNNNNSNFIAYFESMVDATNRILSTINGGVG